MTEFTLEQLSDIIDNINITGECPDELVAMLGGDKNMVLGTLNSVFESAKNDFRAALGLPPKCLCGTKTCTGTWTETCGFTEAAGAVQQVLDLAPEDDADVAVQKEG